MNEEDCERRRTQQSPEQAKVKGERSLREEGCVQLQRHQITGICLSTYQSETEHTHTHTHAIATQWALSSKQNTQLSALDTNFNC